MDSILKYDTVKIVMSYKCQNEVPDSLTFYFTVNLNCEVKYERKFFKHFFVLVSLLACHY